MTERPSPDSSQEPDSENLDQALPKESPEAPALSQPEDEDEAPRKTDTPPDDTPAVEPVRKAIAVKASTTNSDFVVKVDQKLPPLPSFSQPTRGDYDELNERLEALQRDFQASREQSSYLQSELTRLRVIVLGLIVAVFAGLTYGILLQTPGMGLWLRPKTLVAQRLAFLDQNSKVRCTLGVNDDGGTGLSFRSPDGTTRAGFLTDKDGQPSLAFTDKAGKLRSLMSLDERGPKLAFFDEQDHERVAVTSGGHGFPGITLSDKDGRTRARLFVAGTKDTHYSVLSFNDKGGQTRMMFTLDDEGRPSFNFYDRGGERYGSLYIEENRKRPLLYLVNREGRLLWEAGR